MNKPQSNIQLFLHNHLNKDIDQNFIDSLEAIMFLTPPNSEEFNNIYSMSVQPKSDEEAEFGGSYNLAQLLKAKLQSDRYNTYGDREYSYGFRDTYENTNKNTVTYQYNLVDFFIYKLNENLRRCYSEQKSQEKQKSYRHKPHENNKEYLIKSQNYIYQAIDMLEQYISFDKEKKHYAKAILGKDAVMTSIELWTYLNCHEFLTSENKTKHLSILNKHFDNHQFSGSFIKAFKGFIYKKDDIDTINLVLENSDKTDILESLKTSNLKYGWTFAALQHILKNDSDEVSDISKVDILNAIINSKLLDSQFYNTFVSNNKEFENQLSSFFTSIFDIEQDNSDCVTKIVNKMDLSLLGKSHTYDFVINQIKKLDNPHLLVNILGTHRVEPHQKVKLYKLYNWEDQKNIKKVIDIININPNEVENIQQLLTIQDNASNKELLAYIISLNSNKYMEICKSAYMKIKLEERVNKEKPEGTATKVSKGFKI